MRKKKKFLLILIYFVFLVTLFEGFARLAFFLIPQVSKGLERIEDYGWRRWWVDRHRKTGKAIFYKFDIFDPSKGWISKPNIRDMKVFHNKVLNTNSKGFRGKKEYSYNKDPDKVRILILGDSFTFGDEVSDNETYSNYLQEILPHVEVINVGVHGYGHDQMLILLREEGIRYEPDIIILGFLYADMKRNLLKFRDYAKPKFFLDDGELKLTGTPVPHPEDILKWDWARPRTIDMFSLIYHRFRELLGLRKKEKEDITTAILNETIKLADSIHAALIFVYLIPAEEISNSTILMEGEKYFFSMCQTNDKVRCFSTRPYFAEEVGKGTTFKLRGHWGPAGHLTVAKAIKRYLVDEGLVFLP